MGQFIDLTGQEFGWLKVIERDTAKTKRSDGVKWRCKCICGKTVLVRGKCLRLGETKSCGCYRKVSDNPRGFIHGYTGNRIYAEYIDMLKRCRPDYRNHKRYYDRGIYACDEWKGENGVHAFFNWAEHSGYDDKLTLDRIDNDKGYSPENCRWATRKQQANNRSTTIKITREGRTQSLKEWCEELNMDYRMVLNRYRVLGWNIERALTEPPHYGRR